MKKRMWTYGNEWEWARRGQLVALSMDEFWRRTLVVQLPGRVLVVALWRSKP